MSRWPYIHFLTKLKHRDLQKYNTTDISYGGTFYFFFLFFFFKCAEEHFTDKRIYCYFIHKSRIPFTEHNFKAHKTMQYDFNFEACWIWCAKRNPYNRDGMVNSNIWVLDEYSSLENKNIKWVWISADSDYVSEDGSWSCENLVN